MASTDIPMNYSVDNVISTLDGVTSVPIQTWSAGPSSLNTFITYPAPIEFKMKKQLKAYILGPLFAGYIHEEGVDSYLLDFVRKTINRFLPNKPMILGFRPCIIRSFEKQELVLEFPDSEKLVTEEITLTKESILFSQFAMIDPNKTEEFLEFIEDSLREQAEGNHEPLELH